MSFHIVSIDSPQCSISCKDGQLTCKTPEGERKLPIEDVASIIITSFSANIHSHLFLEAAKHGVALIICEDFKPVSLVLPANRSTDTLLSRALLKLTPPTLGRLWQQTVDAKCHNQHSLAAHLRPADPAIELLRQTALGKKPHKEAICAKLFWQIFARSQDEVSFSRDRSSEGLNALLNYGYAVLLSTVLQKLFGVGLDPTFGISHATRERSTPLAYDLMEPFRACVEWRVIQWVEQVRRDEDEKQTEQIKGADDWFSTPEARRPQLAVTAEFRKWVTGFPLEKVEYLDLILDVRGCIEGVVRGFRRAVLENSPRYYRPWTPKNSKWVG
jgi:CRISPR-associated protein Cas1